MMRALSAPCAAIVMAKRANTLRLTKCQSRMGFYVAIEDDCGLIEIALSMSEAEQRVQEAHKTEVIG
jgi:hypothetical protein